VMTVHGAKGLEANTVILADTTTKPTGKQDPRLLPLANGELVWATAQKEDAGPMSDARAQAQQEARDEYRRLLYVAMTRAAERLIVCGAKSVNKIPDGCWYQLLENRLKPDCTAEPADDGDGEVWRYRKGAAQPAEPATAVAAIKAGQKSLPEWLTKLARPEAAAMPTIAPSSVMDEETARPPAPGGRSAALLRGSLVHRLLQSLPDIPAERRRKAAEEYLARTGGKLAAEERASMVEQIMLVLEDARFYELYGPGSRAEVPIVGRLILGGRPVRVSGQIDRLAVTQSSVLIADFKTNRPPPRRIEEVPPAYVTQLALYRAVLAKLYPQRPLRAALIWTEAPDLMELSGEALDAGLARITSAR
jgi:ATP-dependent helicase/nuclease subunit A